MLRSHQEHRTVNFASTGKHDKQQESNKPYRRLYCMLTIAIVGFSMVMLDIYIMADGKMINNMSLRTFWSDSAALTFINTSLQTNAINSTNNTETNSYQYIDYNWTSEAPYNLTKNIMPLWKQNYIQWIKKEKKYESIQKLYFIHIPKTGGTYIRLMIQGVNKTNHLKCAKTHYSPDIIEKSAIKKNIYFAAIRDPVDRMESFLNYKMDKSKHKGKLYNWPKHLEYIYYDSTISLNTIVELMTNEELMFHMETPYKTLVDWSVDVDIFITIDEFSDLLELFGYQ